MKENFTLSLHRLLMNLSTVSRALDSVQLFHINPRAHIDEERVVTAGIFDFPIMTS